jgi:hypothetical protein
LTCRDSLSGRQNANGAKKNGKREPFALSVAGLNLSEKAAARVG